MEIYKRYQHLWVSNFGNVYSTRRRRHLVQKHKGYFRVNVWDGKTKPIDLHRPVMQLFGPPNPDPTYYTEIDHIDQDIHNNRIDNLRFLPPWKNQLNRECAGYWFRKRTNKYEARLKIRMLVH